MSGGGLAVSWLDVFTDRPLAGNPLAVVPDADELDERRMQALAAELGLSETVYVFGGAERLRIFTPATELPLAGHPVVGATHELARLGRLTGGRARLATGAGPVEVALSGEVATMTQAEPRLGDEVDPVAAARMLGAETRAVVGTPRLCTTTGVPQAFARVRDRATLSALRPDLAAMAAFDAAEGVVAWCEDGDVLRQRFFGPRMGVSEDPATGSAAGALCALRVFEGGAPGRATVRQGDELGRPSTIEVEVDGEPGRPGRVRVGGRAVRVLEATVTAETLAAL